MKTLLTLSISILFCLSANAQCISFETTPSDAFCPAIFDPVCGCNGYTYGNTCEAMVRGVQVVGPPSSACPFSSCFSKVSGLSHTVGISGDITLSWTPEPAAIAYRVQGRLLGTSNWQTGNTTIFPPASSYTLPGGALVSGATYEWRVIHVCSFTGPEPGFPSSPSTLVGPAPRLGNPAIDLQISPNPVSENLFVRTDLEGNFLASIYSTSGTLVRQMKVSAGIPISVADLPGGLYSMVLQDGEMQLSGSFVVQR